MSSITATNTVEAALGHAAQGLPVFPCRATDKHPLTRHGFKDATTDPEQIENWWRAFPRAMIGVPMGEASGIFAVDVDVRDGGREAWAKLTAENGLSPTREHATPSGGKHIFFRWQPGISNSRGRLPDGIDVRGDGGFVIVPPSVNADGKAYTVSTDADIADAPPWLLDFIKGDRPLPQGKKLPAALLEILRTDAGKGISTNPYDLPQPADADKLRAALAAVSSDDYQTWFEVGCALWNELGDAGWPIFEEWSAKSHKYNARDSARQWDSCRGYRFTAGTIFHYAKEADPDWWQASESRVE